MTDKEKIAAIKEKVRIEDYASHSGYTVSRAGRYITLLEQPTVRIDGAANRYWNNGYGGKGSIIDFVMEFENQDLASAIQTLSVYAGLQKERTPERKITPKKEKQVSVTKKAAELQLPEADEKITSVYAYLIKTRNIDRDIVVDFIKRKQLYQDKNRNCVFVSYSDNVADFACIRGTGFKRFAGDVSGSNCDHCFYVSNNATSLVVTESVIDAMSIMSELKAQEMDYKQFDYLALSGVNKLPAIKNHLARNEKIETVCLALDNDEPGRKATTTAIEQLKQEYSHVNITVHTSRSKDWNEDRQKGNAVFLDFNSAVIAADEPSRAQEQEQTLYRL